MKLFITSFSFTCTSYGGHNARKGHNWVEREVNHARANAPLFRFKASLSTAGIMMRARGERTNDVSEVGIRRRPCVPGKWMKRFRAAAAVRGTVRIESERLSKLI